MVLKKMITKGIKLDFFKVVAVSLLLYSCITWTLTKRLEKKLDGATETCFCLYVEYEKRGGETVNIF